MKAVMVLEGFNRIWIHHDSHLVSYSLDILARLMLYQSPPSALDSTLEHIANDVSCCVTAKINGQATGKTLSLLWRK